MGVLREVLIYFVGGLLIFFAMGRLDSQIKEQRQRAEDFRVQAEAYKRSNTQLQVELERQALDAIEAFEHLQRNHREAINALGERQAALNEANERARALGERIKRLELSNDKGDWGSELHPAVVNELYRDAANAGNTPHSNDQN